MRVRNIKAKRVSVSSNKNENSKEHEAVNSTAQILTQKSVLFIMGGGLYDDGGRAEKRLIKRLNCSLGTTKDKSRIEADAKRWKKDYRIIIDNICVRSNGNRSNSRKASSTKKDIISSNSAAGLELWRVEAAKLQPTKSENESLLRLFFKTPAQSYVIYWSGHGEPDTGDWCFSKDEKISLENLLDLWMEPTSIGYQNDKTLLIVSDSCYSGGWIDHVKVNLVHQQKYQKCRIAIQCASKADEEAFVHVISEEYLSVASKNPAIADYTSKLPDTLLMRKMIFEHHRDIKSYEQRFPWTYIHQTPCYYFTPNLNKLVSEFETDTGEKYCIVKTGNSKNQFSFRMFGIGRCWQVSKDHKTANFHFSKTPYQLKGLFFSGIEEF